MEKVDDHTVKVLFDQPTPFWALAFVGAQGMIIPKHLYADYMGAKSRDAPANLKPVGTGPYMFKDFKPGDMVQGVINPKYYMENRPYFDSFEMKGGGDAVSAARAVLQTGEYDYAWNVLVEGPWCHGCWARRDGTSLGGANFGSNTSAFYQENIEFPFFMHFLKDKGDISQIKEVNLFDTGANEWRSFDTWEPKAATERLLGQNVGLGSVRA